ncbi:MAG: hypothetical protein KDC37_03895 [Flavobacteriales bacterium]|nr:hypothetical protein [Flavobacteriales bacterium]
MIEIPASFYSMLKEAGLDTADIAKGLQMEPSAFVRLHPAKFPTHLFPTSSPGHAMVCAIQLPYRPKFALDPWLHAGAYYVQDGSSIFLGEVMSALQLQENIRIAVDACASPGGKSTLLLDCLTEHSLLVSNESIRNRGAGLSENLEKWGYPNYIQTHADPHILGQLPLKADLLLVDAPCSGEGMFRKDAQALEMWKPELVHHCAARQKRILADVLPVLKDDGIVIYSTCTFNRKENEEVILAHSDRLLPLDVNLPTHPHLHSRKEGGFTFYRMLPGEGSGEGLSFCICRYKSPFATETPSRRFRKAAPATFVFKSPPFALPEGLILLEDGFGVVHVFPQEWQWVLSLLMEKHIVVQFGQAVLARKGKTMKSMHGRAMIHGIATELSTVALSYSEALRYLRRETFNIPEGAAGEKCMTFQGVHLGLINDLGRRWNNLYPASWRLRMELPSEIPVPWWQTHSFTTSAEN